MVDGGLPNGAPAWIFVKRPPMAKQRDPIQGEFFNTDSITTAADEVVREAVQNTLDAKSEKSGGVRVRFYVSGSEGALPAAEAGAYFAGFSGHTRKLVSPTMDIGNF